MDCPCDCHRLGYPRLAKSFIFLDLYINGKWKTTYTLQATQLESFSNNLGEPVVVRGDNTHFRLDIPVIVS